MSELGSRAATQQTTSGIDQASDRYGIGSAENHLLAVRRFELAYHVGGNVAIVANR
ncbi:MAG: hypothetical protein V4527_13500 [Pseudomonadota bacterium]